MIDNLNPVWYNKNRNHVISIFGSQLVHSVLSKVR